LFTKTGAATAGTAAAPADTSAAAAL